VYQQKYQQMAAFESGAWGGGRSDLELRRHKRSRNDIMSAGRDRAAVGHKVGIASRLPIFKREEVDALSLPTIERWVPEAVADAAERLHAELAAENKSDGLAVLARLVSDPRMDLVWGELYKQKRDSEYQTTEEFLYPARVTNASWAAIHRQQAVELRKIGGKLNESEARLLEAEATLEEGAEDAPTDRWSEQDRAVQTFLSHACHSAVDIQPVFLADIQDKLGKLGKVSASLREQAKVLKSLGLGRDARKLGEIAADCDDEAWNLEPNKPGADDPWIITRRRADPKVRTFVADLSIQTQLLFGNALLGTLATVANVVFNRNDMTDAKVREWLR
jgi:hypothetical protein